MQKAVEYIETHTAMRPVRQTISSGLTYLNRVSKPSITRRLALGYVTTLGLAACGIQLGQVIANQWVKQPAQIQLNNAYDKAAQLGDLQKAFLESKSVISAYIRRPELLNDYGYHLLNRARQLQDRLDALPVSDFKADSPQMASAQSISTSRFETFWTPCQAIGEQYENELLQLLDWLTVIAPEGALSQTTSDRYAQTKLLDFLGSQTMLQLESCSLSLEELVAETQEDVIASGRALEQATELQSVIIQASLAVSLIAAIAFALYNSWAITRPLSAVSQVAQQVTKESNFELQAPVTTSDEVGTVAESLNALISQVKQLLQAQQRNQQQLEHYNQTLEFTVQTRTQELNEKNENLQQTVEALNEAQSQLVQAEKMSSLGQLVAGIAHEINNPVNFIHGNLKHADAYVQDLLEVIALFRQHTQPTPVVEEKLEDVDIEFLTEDMTKLLKSMRMGTERIKEIVLSLRNFSRLDESDGKTADIHEGINSTLLILAHRLKANEIHPNIEVVKRYGDLPLVACFPGQLNQVVMNVLANAIDALEEHGVGSANGESKPTITITTEQVDEHQVRIAIADNSIGMPATVQARIFEPFYTTKDVGKGTGMGLSISYKIITERHEGKLTCQSVADEGTVFAIELPIGKPIDKQLANTKPVAMAGAV